MSKTKLTSFAFAVVLLGALASCDAQRAIPDPVSSQGGAPGAECTRCHGDPARGDPDPLVNAAPPVTPDGSASGAHLAHVGANAIRGPLDCSECHVVPTSTRHANGVVEVTFGALARKDGASPQYVGGTCASVYCHGATIDPGGPKATPGWADAGGVSCTSCHGYPPKSHAPTATACFVCHPGTTKAPTNEIQIALGNHINGAVDVHVHPTGWRDPASHGQGAKQDLATCASCHGADFDGGFTGRSCNACHEAAGFTAWRSNCTFCHGAKTPAFTMAEIARAAPPKSTRGETSAAARGVGAHQKHLSGGALTAPLACADCHAVPSDLSHLDGTPRLAFGDKASQHGAFTPSFDPVALTCANYCHGATLDAGGSNTTPRWTGGSAEAACGACHSAPPPAPHPQSTSCGSCHGAGYSQTTVNVATHVNGTVDVGAMTCTSCHGDANRAANKPAPPMNTRGETATTARGVGAHQKHLSGGALRDAIACSECHALPGSTTHSNGTVDFTWGPLARSGGATPAFDRDSATCANYCHGATLDAGGSNTTPVWTAGAGEAACGACHSAPPPAPHVQSTQCGVCHQGYTSTSVNPATHVNGSIEVSSGHPAGWAAKDQHGYTATRTGFATCKACHGEGLDGGGGAPGPACASCHGPAGFPSWQSSCTFCHGNRAAGTPNPPVDTQGRTAATNVSVGVHASHVGTNITTPLRCTDCHQDRAGSNVITDAAHVDGDGVAEVTFGARARTGGVSPTYTRASATSSTCSSTYCHGNFTGGRGAVTMSWTSTTQVTCTSCHGIPANFGPEDHHDERNCADCHPGYTSSSVNPATHVDGVPTVGNKIRTYDRATRTCTNACHESERWR